MFYIDYIYIYLSTDISYTFYYLLYFLFFITTLSHNYIDQIQYKIILK